MTRRQQHEHRKAARIGNGSAAAIMGQRKQYGAGRRVRSNKTAYCGAGRHELGFWHVFEKDHYVLERRVAGQDDGPKKTRYGHL